MVPSIRRDLVVWWVPLSIGCTGAPAEPIDTGDVQTTKVDLDVNDTLETHCAATGEKPLFEVTSPADGRIHVVHTGEILPDCGVYQVYLEIPEFFHLMVDYGRIGDYNATCGGSTCMWTFTWDTTVPDGDWTVELRSTHESRTVTVE